LEGDALATLKEVAARAGVSTATASRILNKKQTRVPVSKETAQKVLAAAASLGYYPDTAAQSLRTRETHTVGVIVMDITDPYFAGLLDAVEKILNRSEYHFLLSSAQNSLQEEQFYLSVLRRSRVDGLLILGGTQRFTEAEIDQLVASRVPIVVVGRVAPSPLISSVSIDNLSSAQKATSHLVELGCRRIVHFSTEQWRADAERRREGYERALAEAGGTAWVEKGSITEESGYRLMDRVLGSGARPDGLFAYNDRLAIGAMRAAREHGLRVPEDIAVVGFDDIPFALYVEPSLTTVRQPVAEMGRLGAELLLQGIRNREASRAGEHREVDTELIIRKSTVGAAAGHRRNG
jgi:LacI family repressor for deo operon, udp, cdd, tsx, nupC, and nupG